MTLTPWRHEMDHQWWPSHLEDMRWTTNDDPHTLKTWDGPTNDDPHTLETWDGPTNDDPHTLETWDGPTNDDPHTLKTWDGPPMITLTPWRHEMDPPMMTLTPWRHEMDHQWLPSHLEDRVSNYPQPSTHWDRDKMDAISQKTFSNAFSWMKKFEFQLEFHWSLFPSV